MDELDFSSGKTKKKNDASQRLSPLNHYSSLYIDNPSAIFIVNEKAEIISVNKRFTELLGFTLEEIEESMRGKEFLRRSREIRPYFQKALQGTPISLETVFIHKKGWHILARLTLIPEKRENRVVYIFGLCTDLRGEKKCEKKIVELLNYLNRAEKNTNIGTWDYDLKENKTFFSNQTYRIFGIEAEKNFVITLDSLAPFFPSTDFEKWKIEIFTAIENKEGFELAHQIVRSDGEIRDIMQRANVLFDERGNITHLVGTIQDVTEVKKIEKELDERTSQFYTIADRLRAAIWSIDMIKAEYSFCSRGVEEIYGIKAADFKKDLRLWLEFVHPHDREMVEAKQERLHKGQELVHQYRIIDRNGNIKWLSDNTVPVLDKEGNLVRLDGIITDITEEKNHAEEQIFMANHDYLTKLPNRRCFEKMLNELLEKSKQEGRSFAVFYLDLDKFKYINDTLGHELGDKFLQAISERLHTLIGDQGFLARMGGDEFTVCLKETKSRKEILERAGQLLREIEKPFYFEGYDLYTSASIGISFFPNDGEDAETLIRNADRALYKAKESGKNDWELYSSSMNIETYKNSHLEKDLRKAINNNQFFLEYQPKVHLRTEKIIGAEALLRWKHPERGIVSPGEFIPIAEEAGLISKLGDWVLKEVCNLQRRLLQKGIATVPLCVNISPKRLLKADFIRNVKECIQEAGIAPTLIELELTESVIIENTEKTKDILSELKSFGVTFALDDFGTGYSSLTYLKDLDLDTLKIDRSFTKGIGMNKANEAIIKALILLAKELGMIVIAEGVEKKEQLDFLLQHDCPIIQGYIFSRPVSEEILENMLMKGVLKPQIGNN